MDGIDGADLCRSGQPRDGRRDVGPGVRRVRSEVERRTRRAQLCAMP